MKKRSMRGRWDSWYGVQCKLSIVQCTEQKVLVPVLEVEVKIGRYLEELKWW